MGKDLFETLTKMTGCMFVSDLLYLSDKRKLTSSIAVLSSDDFTLSQWNDAVNYFTGKTILFTTSNAAKEYLLTSGEIIVHR